MANQQPSTNHFSGEDLLPKTESFVNPTDNEVESEDEVDMSKLLADVTPISFSMPGDPEPRPFIKLRQRRSTSGTPTRPEWLPEGWTTEVTTRSSGQTKGHTDRYYVSPTGKRLRSRNEVLNFVREQSSAPTTSEPAESTPAKKRRGRPRKNEAASSNSANPQPTHQS